MHIALTNVAWIQTNDQDEMHLYDFVVQRYLLIIGLIPTETMDLFDKSDLIWSRFIEGSLIRIETREWPFPKEKKKRKNKASENLRHKAIN